LQEYVPLSTYVDDLIKLLDNTFGSETPVHVAGWSFGAIIALKLAQSHPGRVKKLVVIQGGYFQPKANHIGSLRPGGETLFGPDWAWVKDLCSYESLSVDERCDRMLQHADIRRKDLAHRDQMCPPYKWVHLMYARSEKLTVMKKAEDLARGVLVQETAVFAEGTAKVEEIVVPTLIIHGRHDGMHTEARAQELQARMPNAELVVLEGEGHVGVVVKSSATITDFLINGHLTDPTKADVSRLPNAPHREKCTKSRILSMQDEIAVLFSKPDFQTRLREIFEGAPDDALQQALGRQKLCREPQMAVIKRYGFPGTSAGWLESVVAVQEFQNDAEVAANQVRIQALLNPVTATVESIIAKYVHHGTKEDQKESSHYGNSRSATLLPQWLHDRRAAP